MSFQSAPDKILEAKARLLECSTVTTTWGMADSDVHFPQFDVAGDALPAVCLYEGDLYEVDRASHGESRGRGQVLCVFYFASDGFDLGQVEQDARTLCHQLVELTTEGLFITAARRTRASDPRRSAEAAADDDQGRAYRTISITLDWEG